MIQVDQYDAARTLEWVREQPFSKIPRMTNASELLWVHEWIEEQYTGAGEILEFGCWLGGFTAAMLDALKHHTPTTRPHVFDKFIWQNYMVGVAAELELDEQFFHPGDNFFASWLRNIGHENRSNVNVHIGLYEDRKEVWDQPIELAFLDAMKTRSAVHGFNAWFLPNVITGGTVCDQDYYFTEKWGDFQDIYWDYLVTGGWLEPVCRVGTTLVMVRTCQPLPEPVLMSMEINGLPGFTEMGRYEEAETKIRIDQHHGDGDND